MTSGFNRSPTVSFTTSEDQEEDNTDEKDSSEKDGNLIAVIGYIFTGVVGFLMVSLVIIIILVKRRRAKENMKETEEKNSLYGREYYQDTQLVDRNDYYRKQ